MDIARETRTSVSTVSRVLGGGAMAERISELTRQRVQEAASRLGYRPNLLARSLRTRRTNTIGLLVSDIANSFFGQIASLAERSLHRQGYTVVLCNSADDLEREREYLRLLPQKGIDGLILVPLTRSKRALMELLPPQMPLVILDRPIVGMDGCVATDQEQAGQILCQTLKRVGVKKVAIATGPQHVYTHRQRHDCIAREFQVIAEHSGPAQKDTGRQAFIQFLTTQPDAIICTNNFLGQGLIDAIMQVDHPLVIGCFDEIPMMHLLPLPIVCSVQDVPMLADACAAELLRQLNGAAPQERPTLLPAEAMTNPAFQQLHVQEG